MTDAERHETASGGEDTESSLPDWAVGLLTVEAVAVLIGLAMPVTPSKTGSTWSPAQLITPDPSYLMEVAVYFVMTNLLVVLLALCVWVYSKFRKTP